MKKLMLVLGLMGIVILSFAGEKNTRNIREVKIEKSALPDLARFDNDYGSGTCTVTQTGKINVHFIEYSVSCSATEATCDAAITSSLNCVRSALNRLRQVLQ